MNKLVLYTAIVCAVGCEPFKDVCVCDAPTEQGTSVKPLDEKLPEGRMPSWQRDGIVVINAPNLEAEDRKIDAERAEADAEGKKTAGIKP